MTEIKQLKSNRELNKLMGNYFTRLKKAGNDPDSKIAWCSSVGPVELLYSMGFEVYFPENHAAMIGTAKNADKYITSAVSRGYSSETCAYMTSDIGAFIQGESPLKKFNFNSLPEPDVLVYNTNQCSVVQDWFSYYARYYGAPIGGIHTPLNIDEVGTDTVEFITSQTKDLIPLVEETSGKTFSKERFSRTVKRSRKACRLWKKVLETAVNKPAPLTFFDGCIHMGPVVMMRGTTEPIEYYKKLLDELEARVEKGIGALEHERYRTYWDGMPIWGQLRNLAHLFIDMKICVAASTYCNSWAFEKFDPAKPFDSTSRAYTELFIARSERKKREMLEEMLKKYSIDGVVYHDAKTCPRNTNCCRGLQNRLSESTGVPYIQIDGDMNDLRCFSLSQTEITVETFRDQLRMKSGS